MMRIMNSDALLRLFLPHFDRLKDHKRQQDIKNNQEKFEMQKSLEIVKEQLQELKPKLRKRFKVESIDIFGSYARGDQTDASDIDLLVTYSEGADLLLVAGLRSYLKRKLRVKVDVVSKKYLNPIIKEQVLNEAIPV